MAKRKLIQSRVRPKKNITRRPVKQPIYSKFSTFILLTLLSLTLVIGYFYSSSQAPNQINEIGRELVGGGASYGIAARFDGNGFLKVNNSEGINPQIYSGFVAEAWIRPQTANASSMYIIDKTSGNTNNFSLRTQINPIVSEGKYYVNYTFAVAQSNCFESYTITSQRIYTTPEEVTSWHHVAGVIQTSGQLDIFVDGQRSTMNSNKIYSTCKNSLPVQIGARVLSYSSSTPTPTPSPTPVPTTTPTPTPSPSPSPTYVITPSATAYDASGYFIGEMDEVHIANYAKYTENFTPSIYPIPRKEVTTFLFHFDNNLNDSIKTISAYAGIPMGTGVTFVPTSVVVDPPSPSPSPSSSPTPPPTANPSSSISCLPALFKVPNSATPSGDLTQYVLTSNELNPLNSTVNPGEYYVHGIKITNISNSSVSTTGIPFEVTGASIAEGRNFQKIFRYMEGCSQSDINTIKCPAEHFNLGPGQSTVLKKPLFASQILQINSNVDVPKAGYQIKLKSSGSDYVIKDCGSESLYVSQSTSSPSPSPTPTPNTCKVASPVYSRTGCSVLSGKYTTIKFKCGTSSSIQSYVSKTCVSRTQLLNQAQNKCNNICNGRE